MQDLAQGHCKNSECHEWSIPLVWWWPSASQNLTSKEQSYFSRTLICFSICIFIMGLILQHCTPTHWIAVHCELLTVYIEGILTVCTAPTEELFTVCTAEVSVLDLKDVNSTICKITLTGYIYSYSQAGKFGLSPNCCCY